MNRSKIEWCDHTWNPITGCLHNCPYCYAKRMVTLLARSKRGSTAKSYAFMCDNCFEQHCKMIGCAVPDLFRGESEE